MNGESALGMIRFKTHERQTNGGLFVPADRNEPPDAQIDPKACQVLVFNCQETKTFSLYAYNRYKCERVNELFRP